MMFVTRVIAGAILFALAMTWLSGYLWPAHAQEHQHPTKDVPLHEKYYSNWMRPDDPTKSCCGGVDCAPVAAKLINGSWWAKRHWDGKWIKVPPEKIEWDRDSPDGSSHLCSAPPTQGDAIYCFVVGSGG